MACPGGPSVSSSPDRGGLVPANSRTGTRIWPFPSPRLSFVVALPSVPREGGRTAGALGEEFSCGTSGSLSSPPIVGVAVLYAATPAAVFAEDWGFQFGPAGFVTAVSAKGGDGTITVSFASGRRTRPRVKKLTPKKGRNQSRHRALTTASRDGGFGCGDVGCGDSCITLGRVRLPLANETVIVAGAAAPRGSRAATYRTELKAPILGKNCCGRGGVKHGDANDQQRADHCSHENSSPSAPAVIPPSLVRSVTRQQKIVEVTEKAKSGCRISELAGAGPPQLGTRKHKGCRDIRRPLSAGRLLGCF